MSHTLPHVQPRHAPAPAGAAPWPAFEQTVAAIDAISEAAARNTRQWMGLPFDAMRLQYAAAVQAGLIERSMLKSREFERTVDALEHLAYGPFARHV